ncbi:DUF305 domain-containing protein [Prauserella oleivorans]|uniref:DUF305 domain-containing protein n=1 Tax=Prauserella oleivorans TaxID=1478153 RepID=A0ABW5W7B0_9PSEU
MGRRLAAAVAALFCLAAGCTGEAPEPRRDTTGVIVPGRPGEQATVVPGGEAGDYRRAGAPSEADVAYVRMMIPHHQQAITMTDLVADRASNAQVKAIAERIAATQQAEITLMRSWLADHGHSHADGGHGGHARMPGMATPEQLEALRAAEGAEFDRQFLRLMITHHEGALTMAEDQLAHGVDPRAVAMAQDVVTGQTDEIGHLRRLLGS